MGDLTEDIIDGIVAMSESSEVSEDSEVSGFSESSEYSDILFDLTGRKVSDLKPHTVYIKNGKKIMGD